MPTVHCCTLPGRAAAPVLAVDPIGVALTAASRCVGRELMLVLMESILHLGLMERSDFQAVLQGCPAGTLDVIETCRRSESGTETMIRDRLLRKGVHVKSQVWIGTIGRVDLLVGRRLVIEADSVAHHTSLDNYHADRLRDLRLVAAGYQVVRLTYQQVMFGWAEAEQYLLAIIRRGEHRRPPRGRNLALGAGAMRASPRGAFRSQVSTGGWLEPPQGDRR